MTMSLSPATKNKCQAAKILNDLISFDSEDEEEDLCTSEINAASLSSSKPLLDSSSSSSLISSFRYSLEEDNLTEENLDKYVKIEEIDGSNETRYILDFGFFLKKGTYRQWEINTTLLKHIRDFLNH